MAVAEWSVLSRQRAWMLVLVNGSITLLILYLVCSYWDTMLEFLIIIANLPIFPLSVTSFAAPILKLCYIVCMNIEDCQVLWQTAPFIIMYKSSLSWVIVLTTKSTLSDINVITVTLFQLESDGIYFPYFYFESSFTFVFQVDLDSSCFSCTISQSLLIEVLRIFNQQIDSNLSSCSLLPICSSCFCFIIILWYLFYFYDFLWESFHNDNRIS